MAWREGVKILTQSQVDILSLAPLWQNQNFPDLCGHPDSTWWAHFGITHLSHIFEENTLLPFESIRHKYGIENKFFFKYLLLRHALKTQFGALTIELRESFMEDLLSFPEINKLVMTFYGRLQMMGVDPFQKSLCKWQRIMPELSEEDWEEAAEICFQDIISTADVLIQFKFIHHLHYTPARLVTMEPGRDIACARCKMIAADFFHMFWTCPGKMYFLFSTVSYMYRCRRLRRLDFWGF